MKKRKLKQIERIQDSLCLEVKHWATSIGTIEATIALMRAGISASVSDKLARGDYWSKPRLLVEKAINEAMNNKAS